MAINISNDVLSRAVAKVHPEVVGTLDAKTSFLTACRKAGKVLPLSSYELRVPVEIAESTQATDHSANGWSSQDMSVARSTDYMRFNYARITQKILFNEKDRNECSDVDAALALVEQLHKGVVSQMKRNLNRQIISGNVAAYQNFGSLNGMAVGGDSVGGFFEALAVASQTGSVGGLDKETYPAAKGLRNQYASAGGNFATSGLKAFRSLATQASLLSPDESDVQDFHAILLHPTTFNLLQEAGWSGTRFMDAKSYEMGMPTMYFNGASVYADAAFQTTAGADIGDTNLKLSGLFLNFDAVTMGFLKGQDFAVTDFERLPSQDGCEATVSIHGALIAKKLGACGILVHALA
jgi:hypothetical protein